MASREPPQDETSWQAPGVAAQFAGVHENTVLYYFAQSPFFDPTSNNAIVFTQSQITNPEVLGTRASFEAELDKRQGLEFRVFQSHLNHGPDALPDEGRWVIRKQMREKQPAGPDKVTVLATYFVIGTLILMAPSIGNVLWSKLLDTVHKFEQFTTKASTLPSFSPSLGHHYLRQSSQNAERSRAGSTGPSRSGSPTPSQEDVSMSGVQDSAEPAKSTTAATNESAMERRALFDAFQTFMTYGNEYVDDVELVGEPGNFSFKRKEISKQQSTKPSAPQTTPANQQGQAASTQAKPTASPQVKAEPSPEPSKIDGISTGKLKPKRRKSKAPTSPMSPLTAPATPAP